MVKTKIGSNASFTGPQKGLTILGAHCMAYSGLVAKSASAVDLLEFNSGKGYIVGTITGIGNSKIAAPADGGITIYQVYFNGEEVLRIKCEAKEETSPTVLVVPIMIPPLTYVKVTAISQYGTAAYETSVSIVGRVYA